MYVHMKVDVWTMEQESIETLSEDWQWRCRRSHYAKGTRTRVKKTKYNITTGDGRRRLRLLFVTEQNVALQNCREAVFHRTGSHALQ